MEEADFEEAVDYATISLPWTFNRMHYNPRKQSGVNRRLWHIMSGVLNQSILERELKRRGYKCKMDWSGYREDDIFDFRIKKKIYDVKTQTYFSSYDKQNHRRPFTPELMMKYKSYSGPKWRTFFPVLVPMTQLNVAHIKNGYIFGFAATVADQTKLKPKPGDGGYWCSAPFADAHVFFHNNKLIKEREKAGKGFRLVLKWAESEGKLDDVAGKLKITIFGEWDEDKNIQEITLRPGQRIVVGSEMSSLSCIKVDHPASLGNSDFLEITASNNFKEFVPDNRDPSLNINNSKFVWEVGKDSFINLRVQKKYLVYWLGHIPLEEFAKRFLDYPSWFQPKKNPDENVEGRISNDFKKKLEGYDRRRKKATESGIKTPWPELAPRIHHNTINAGFMISASYGPQSLGAACYCYPPYGFFESAMYVLSQDLHLMDTL